MRTVFARTALLPDGWAENTVIDIDDDGWIIGVDPGRTSVPSGSEVLEGPVIPGMANVHSHAFQRAMAGLAERASGKKDSFWSWRDTMYRFLEKLGPKDMTAIARQAYIEMLKAGYTAVGEFHYLHHQPDGTPYDDACILARHHVAAALETGIAITIMPVLYAYGGFGNQPVAGGQRRFVCTVDGLMAIVERLWRDYHTAPQVTVGFAHHSLRAVSPEMLTEGTAAARALDPSMPIHIHAAEQMAEVEGCLSWSGKRPVEWLLERAGLDERWCLVHATHTTPEEIRGIVQSGAVVGLCPTTEANLGDGIFPLMEFALQGGRFGIGSDSHISISMIEELRWAEYVQRLQLQSRTLVRTEDILSVGAALFEKAKTGGAQALGRPSGDIAAGKRADLLVLDENHPALAGKVRDHILDAMVFAASSNPVRHVMAGGRWVVRDGHHEMEGRALESYRKALAALVA